MKKKSKNTIKCAYTDLVPVGELKPNPRNPNRHPDEQVELLARLIEAQGWRAPVTVSKLSGLIVRGHGRYLAAKLLAEKDPEKYVMVPVDYQDYPTAAAENADLIADNQIAEYAIFSPEKLAEIIEEIETADRWKTGLTEKTIAELLGEIDDDKKNLENGEYKYKVIVECENESQQKRLLKKFERDGLKCQALIV